MKLEEVEIFVAENVDESTGLWISSNLWRGTLASVAYEGLRVPSVHGLGSAGGIAFSTATLDGEPVPDITFVTLWDTLQPMFDEARSRSLSTNMWFGHDLKIDEGEKGQENEAGEE